VTALQIDCPFVEKVLVNFIREEVLKAGYKRGILGLSGGLDSVVCACLAARALGGQNVVAMIMPYGKLSARDVEDALKAARKFGIRHHTVDISPQIDAYFSVRPSENKILKGNKMSRERMSIIYDYSAREKALPLGTSNKTELLIGYGTIFGDMASAINPLGDLYKTQVRQLAAHLKVPGNIIAKAPSAGLWAGQTDEAEIGLDYERLDLMLYHLIDLRMNIEKAAARGFDKAALKKVARMIERSEFKRKMPQIAKLSFRTVGHDFLYPYDRGK